MAVGSVQSSCSDGIRDDAHAPRDTSMATTATITEPLLTKVQICPSSAILAGLSEGRLPASTWGIQSVASAPPRVLSASSRGASATVEPDRASPAHPRSRLRRDKRRTRGRTEADSFGGASLSAAAAPPLSQNRSVDPRCPWRRERPPCRRHPRRPAPESTRPDVGARATSCPTPGCSSALSTVGEPNKELLPTSPGGARSRGRIPAFGGERSLKRWSGKGVRLRNRRRSRREGGPMIGLNSPEVGLGPGQCGPRIDEADARLPSHRPCARQRAGAR